MTRKQCKDGLDMYKKFVVRMDNVAKFLKTAEVIPNALPTGPIVCLLSVFRMCTVNPVLNTSTSIDLNCVCKMSLLLWGLRYRTVFVRDEI